MLYNIYSPCGEEMYCTINALLLLSSLHSRQTKILFKLMENRCLNKTQLDVRSNGKIKMLLSFDFDLSAQ
jgi:hypothetical protein